MTYVLIGMAALYAAKWFGIKIQLPNQPAPAPTPTPNNDALMAMIADMVAKTLAAMLPNILKAHGLNPVQTDPNVKFENGNLIITNLPKAG